MKKPAQRAAIAPPERKSVPWHWKAVALILGTAMVLGGVSLFAKPTAPAVAVEAPAPHYPSGSELDQYVVKVAIGGGHGSGVVVGDGTYVLTAGHVAAAAGATGEVLIVRQDGTAVDGEVLWVGLNDDLALIKIAEKLPAAPLACEAPVVGGAIEVVGHPGFGQTLDWAHTKGHVVQIYDNGYGQKQRRLFFFDANVYFGNSGGPIFDERGRVIGIVSALLGVNVGGAFSSMVVPFGYNIAVPTDVACGMMPL